MEETMKTFSFALLALILIVGFASSLQARTQVKSDTRVHQSMIVSAEWLAQHLKEDSLVLLQVGEKDEYVAGHIPGAQFITLADISTPRGAGLALELPPVAQLKAAFEKLGVSDKSRIIVYFSKDWVSPTARVVHDARLSRAGRPHVNSRRGLASVACREPACDGGVARTQSRSLNTATKRETCGRRLMG
jgi:rhodanese-related sulfurtransferase